MLVLRRSARTALFLLVASLVPPAAAHAAPGDLLLRKGPASPALRPGTAPQSASAPSAPSAAAASRVQELARRRAAFPHEIYGRGFDPSHNLGSRSPRAHVDLFQQMRERAHRRELATAAAPAGVVPVGETSVPGQDTVRVAILRFDFLADRGGDKSSGDGKFDLSARDTLNRPLDPTPHDKAFFASHGEALRRYYRDQFAGRVVFEFSVYPSAPDSAFHLSDMADYGPWKFSTDIYGAAVKLFRDQIVAADTSGENIPWHQFDRICLIHAGSDLQSDVNADSPEDIPTFTLGVADTDAVVVGPAKADTVFGCTIGPETIRQDGFDGTINAVYTHEFGHLVFGFRDVYDVVSGLPTVGYWSLMDTGNLLGNSITFPNGTAVYAVGILPPAVDPYQKRLVYDDVPSAPEPVYGNAPNALGDIERNYTVRKVPISGEEYLLLENRLDDLNGNGQLTLARDPNTGVILGPGPADSLEYDFLVPGPGLLVWHVDESVADFFGPRADPGFGLNVNPARPGLEVIEADGLDDLGDFNTPFPLGARSDPWFVGNRTHLSDTTVPKLLTSSGTDPHVDLDVTSTPGPVMTFTVGRQWDLAGWPVRVKQDAHGVAPIVAHLGPNALPCVAWTAADSCLHVRRGDGSLLAAGATDDVVYRAPGPLRPVAAVPGDAAHGGDYLAVAVGEPDQGVAGPAASLAIVRFAGDGTVRHVDVFPLAAPASAGPASQAGPPLPQRGATYVGLADGKVLHVAFSADPDPTGSLVTDATLSSPVSGLSVPPATATLGHFFAAARNGELATSSVPASAGIAPLHDLQPIWFKVGTTERLAVIDRTVGAFRVYESPGEWIVRSSEPAPPLGEAIGPPAVDDIDGDGLPEFLFTTATGRVGYWNDNGALSPGWPPNVEHEPFATMAGPLPIDQAAIGQHWIVASLGNGVLAGLDGQRRRAPGFPLPLSVGARGTGAVDTGNFLVDGPPVLFVAGGDTLLYGYVLFSMGSTGQFASTPWADEGGDAARSWAVSTPFGLDPAIAASATPILPGTLKVYPNPANQSPVTFAFRLRQPGQVTVKIFDTAARQVDSFTRAATASDNAITWDPGARVAGLYVARIEVAGQVAMQPFALIR